MSGDGLGEPYAVFGRMNRQKREIQREEIDGQAHCVRVLVETRTC